MISNNGKTILVVGTQPEWLLNVRGPLIRDLTAANFRVVCVGAEPNDYVEKGLSDLGAEYRIVYVRRNQISLLGDIAYVHGIYKLCREIKPDCFFAYTVKPVVFGSVAASMAGVGNIFALITGLGSVFIGNSWRHRIIRPIVSFLYSRAFKRCARIFFQNPDDKHDMRHIAPGDKSLVVDGSGVDVARFEQTEQPSNPVTFLLIARLLIDKGIREYLAAAGEIKKEFPDVRFLLVGPEDPSAAAMPLDEIAQLESGTDVEYLGALKDVRPVLQECSVYVLPSYREGTPRTVLEALACGRAVITTDAPGCRETVVDGDNGLLVPVKDAVALASAMRQFIERPEQISEMGRRGRLYAERRYDVSKVNGAIIGEIEKVMRASRNS